MSRFLCNQVEQQANGHASRPSTGFRRIPHDDPSPRQRRAGVRWRALTPALEIIYIATPHRQQHEWPATCRNGPVKPMGDCYNPGE